MRKLILLIILSFFSKYILSYDTLIEEGLSINNNALKINDTSHEISFLLAGHLYGKPGLSILPALSVTNNIAVFQDKELDFMILLGDNYRFMKAEHIHQFRDLFLDRINFPVYNAVGNHDINGGEGIFLRNEYLQEFGTVDYHSFKINNSLFLILNSELYKVDSKSDCSIKGAQLKFFKELLKKEKDYDNLLIFLHKEIDLYPSNNYESDIKPILKNLAKNGKKIYIFSGDLAKRSNDLYYKTDDNYDITFIHTHILDLIDDKVIKVSISDGGVPEFKVISLNNKSVKPLIEYQYSIQKPGKSESFIYRIFTNKLVFLFIFLPILIIVSWYLLKKNN